MKVALEHNYFLQHYFSFITINVYLCLSYSDESEDGLDDNPLLPQPGSPLMQVKEEPVTSLLGEPSGAGSSGMLNTHSLNGVLQSGKNVFKIILVCL